MRSIARLAGGVGQRIPAQVLRAVRSAIDGSAVFDSTRPGDRVFRMITVSGVVTHVDPVYSVPTRFSPKRTVTRLILLLVLLPLLLPLVVAAMAVSLCSSIFFPGREGGLFSDIASQYVAFFLAGKLHGPQFTTPVRDVRLRDVSGSDHLVRISGDFASGNVQIGDNVTVNAFNRRGTLMFWRGQNHSIRSQIRVK